MYHQYKENNLSHFMKNYDRREKEAFMKTG